MAGFDTIGPAGKVWVCPSETDLTNLRDDVGNKNKYHDRSAGRKPMSMGSGSKSIVSRSGMANASAIL